MLLQASPPLSVRPTFSQPSLKPHHTRAVANWLLARLPRDDYDRLAPHLENVALLKRKSIFSAGDLMPDAYFPMSGIVSLLATTAHDETVEVAVVGNDGIIGLPIVLHAGTAPYDAMVLVSGSACRIKADILRAEFRRSGALQVLLLDYAHSLLLQFSQSAVCNRFHTSLRRLSRWLLMAHDRVDLDSLQLTQESLAHVLGLQRTYVNAAARELADAGLIRYRHGKITILNRERLERAACECYSIFRDRMNQLAPTRSFGYRQCR
jgi:CRP-like cAMP-binding protein